MSNTDRNTGSSFESFLEEEGILEEVDAVAIKRVIAWQIKQEMQTQRISKKAMAERLHTSRTQVDRLLDPDNVTVQLLTLTKAAREVGLRFKLSMEPLPRHMPVRVGSRSLRRLPASAKSRARGQAG
jgi:antitoxin HicB